MKKLFVLVVILAVVLIIIIAVFSGGETAAVYTHPYLYDSDYLKEIKKHETDELSHYKLIDTADQVYSIPIDSAIAKFVHENN